VEVVRLVRPDRVVRNRGSPDHPCGEAETPIELAVTVYDRPMAHDHTRYRLSQEWYDETGKDLVNVQF
jgi:hypothetical protein